MNDIDNNDMDNIVIYKDIIPCSEIESAVGALFGAFYNLRKNKEYQEEYDAMGSIIDMLTEDRQHMRKKYPLEIKI